MSSYGGVVLVMRVFVICGWMVARVSKVRRVLSRLGLLFLCGLLYFGFFLCVFWGGFKVVYCESCFAVVSGGASGWFCAL